MGHSFSSTRRAVALQPHSQHFGRTGISMDRDKYDEANDCQSAAGAGPGNAHNASHTGGF